jgi:hypothetical protein
VLGPEAGREEESMRIHRRRRATQPPAAMTLCPPGSAAWGRLLRGRSPPMSASPRRGALHPAASRTRC